MVRDTFPERFDSLRIDLADSILTLTQPSRPIGLGGGYVQPNRVYRLARFGKGSGLEGRWRQLSFRLESLDSDTDTAMREVRRSENDYQAWWDSQVIIEWEIAGGMVRIRYSALWSKLVRDGLRNGESVTLTMRGFDTTSYSSSMPAIHPGYTYPGPKVPDCNQMNTRDWFDQFREANRRPGT